MTSIRSLMSLIMMSEASRMRRARAVSSISDEVSPLWMNLESVPRLCATEVRNAITSCFTTFSISSIFSMSNFAFSLIELYRIPSVFHQSQTMLHMRLSRHPATSDICSQDPTTFPFRAGITRYHNCPLSA